MKRKLAKKLNTFEQTLEAYACSCGCYCNYCRCVCYIGEEQSASTYENFDPRNNELTNDSNVKTTAGIQAVQG